MAPTEAPKRRRKRKPQSSFAARFWWLGVLLAAAAGWYGYRVWEQQRNSRGRLEGYSSSVETLREEYRRYYGKPLLQVDTESQFARAAELTGRRDYGAAAALLEGLAGTAAVPVVFNNLGVIYAAQGDRARSLNAFREALSHDSSYRLVRDNLDRLRSFIADSADPVSVEVEPNDVLRDANAIALDTAVNGQLAGDEGDVDSFRIAVPPPPRDIFAIELVPANTLGGAIRIFDGDLRLIDKHDAAEGNGQPLTHLISPPPNSTLFVQVWGARNSAGPYTLKFRATKAYDAFEPDDDIFSSHRIGFGEPAVANVMDGQDSDFFSFTANQDGQVTVELRNRGTTLIPSLTTYDAERRNIGFGPDVHTPGADLRHTFDVVNGKVYYIQVWSQGNSSGEYLLTIR